MRLKISPLFAMLVLLYIALGKADIMLYYVISVVFHELSHAIVAGRFGYAVSELKLMPYGACIVGELSELTPREEIRIAIAGPLCSIALALLTVALWWVLPSAYPYTQALFEVNISLALTNLLPVFPLDGGRVMLGLLSTKMQRKRAYGFLRIFGLCLSFFTAAAFVASCFFGANATLGIISAFLVLSTAFPPDSERYVSLFELAGEKSRLLRGVTERTVAIDIEAPVSCLTRFLRRGERVRFSVYESGREVYSFSSEQLALVPLGAFKRQKVRQIVKFLSKSCKNSRYYVEQTHFL